MLFLQKAFWWGVGMAAPWIHTCGGGQEDGQRDKPGWGTTEQGLIWEWSMLKLGWPCPQCCWWVKGMLPTAGEPDFIPDKGSWGTHQWPLHPPGVSSSTFLPIFWHLLLSSLSREQKLFPGQGCSLFFGSWASAYFFVLRMLSYPRSLLYLIFFFFFGHVCVPTEVSICPISVTVGDIRGKLQRKWTESGF